MSFGVAENSIPWSLVPRSLAQRRRRVRERAAAGSEPRSRAVRGSFRGPIFRDLARAADHDAVGKIGTALRDEGAVVVDAPKGVVGGRRSELGHDAAEEQRRGEDLLEGGLERGREVVTDQAPSANVLGGAGKAFEMGGVDGGLADFLDIGGMADGAEGEMIVNFEELGRGSLEAGQEDAGLGTQGDDGQAGSELVLNVLAAILDRLEPAVRFFGHEIRRRST